MLRAAERIWYELLITADRSIHKQQNNDKRLIALLVLGTNDWSIIRDDLELIHQAVGLTEPPSFQELELFQVSSAPAVK